MAVTNNQMLSGAFLLIDTVAANAAVVAKGSSTVLYELELDNTANGAASYLKLYNTASPTIGSTAPDAIIMVPASVSRSIVIPSGLTFGTALAYAAVTAGGTAGTTSPASAFIVRMVYV